MPIPGASYSSLPTVGAPTTNPPPPMHPDLNVKIRGWESTGGTLGFVTYSGPTDSLAPHFEGMFGGQVPPFVANDTVNGWDWTTNMPTGPITDWPVTMIALGTSPGDLLGAPPSGYDIGGGMTARVLYADPSSITLKYTGEDNVVTGYTIHVVGVCVEPSLMALYASDDAAGRTQLPALANTQPFGRAQGTSVLVAICDSGSFMDPRSQKDWW